jgi:pimeloyl-ACP methyl ester carboxylesterase
MATGLCGYLIAGGILLAGCAGAKTPPPKTWSRMTAEERQSRLSNTPNFDTRILRYNKGQIEFIERRPDVERPQDSTLRPIVFVHGLGGTMGDFGPLILEADSNRTTVAVNLPGTGRSNHDDNDFTIKAHADALHEFLIFRMGFSKVDLVCHSLGGQICIALALEYPADVSSLTLIDIAGSYEKAEFVKRMAVRFGKINMGSIHANNHPAISIFTGGNQTIINRLVSGDATLISALDSFNQTYRDRIRNLSVPVLLIWGEKDPVFPIQYGFFLLSNIPNARMKVVPYAGHVPQLSHSDLVRGWIGEFHLSLAPAAPAAPIVPTGVP